MQAHAYYLQLRSALDYGAEGVPIKVTLDELSDRLYCTPRNAKILLKKMTEAGWVRWEPGRGRGNVSQLTFVMPRELVVMEAAMDSAIKGDLEEAFQLIRGEEQSKKLTDAFVAWLYKHLGYKEIHTEEKPLATLHIPMRKPIVTLDPAYSFYAVDGHLVRQVFDTLVLYDPEANTFEAKLSHHWEPNADGTIWTFYLRKGVRFHNRRELTAEDVAFTFDRLMDPILHSPHNWLVENVKEAKAVDRYVVEIHLRQPNFAFLRLLQHAALSIVPKDIYQTGDESLSKLPVGTGAFRIERNNDYMIRMIAFDDYFGYRPHLDLIELWVLPDHDGEYSSSIVWGEVACDRRGAIIPFPTSNSEQTADGLPSGNWTNTERPTYGCGLLTFNHNRTGPMQEESFRRAIDLLIGREEMIRQLGGNRETPARGFYPSVSHIDVAPLDIEEARKLLQSSSYSGEMLKLYTYSQHLEDAKWVAAQCALVGVRLEVSALPEKQMTHDDAILEADMILYQLVVEDDLICLFELLKMSNSYVRAHMNPELARLVDTRIEELWAVPDEHERRRRFGKLIEELQSHKTFLFMLHKTWRTAYPGSVRGVVFNSFGWIDFKQAWFMHGSGSSLSEQARL